MARFSSFPDLYDDMRVLSVSDLKRMGFLNTNAPRNSSITWSRNGTKIASIGIRSMYRGNQFILELNYLSNGKPMNYAIETVQEPSNLGKGLVWYLICPHTGKRCRKLHLLGGYFLHRTAFKGCMYESQTYSKKTRDLHKLFDLYFPSDEIYKEYYKKNRKKVYAGKPTKREAKLSWIIERSEAIPYPEKEKIFFL